MQNNDLTKIIAKVVLEQPLDLHEKAVLTYTRIVLADFKVKTNTDLIEALEFSPSLPVR